MNKHLEVRCLTPRSTRTRTSLTALLKLSVAAVGEQHVQQIVLEVGVAGEPFMGFAQGEQQGKKKRFHRGEPQSSSYCPACIGQ
jgi:hypothetical protein